jgi:hypothetical protein
MKRYVILFAVLAAMACATFLRPSAPGGLPGGMAVLVAQSLPFSGTLAWDANQASDEVTHYVVRQDGVVIGQPTGTTQAVTITTAGPHTWTIVAVNFWASSAPLTYSRNVTVPGVPGNPRFQ